MSTGADRRGVERWLVSHGVPNFVIGRTRPGRLLLPVTLWSVGLAIATTVVLIATTDLAGLAVLAGLGVLVGAAIGVYVVIASGLIPLSLFGLRFLSRTILRGGSTMVTVLPLLLVAVAFLFLGAETWQSIGRLHGMPLVLTALLFVALGVAFVLRQVRPDLEAGATMSDPAAVRAALPAELRFSDEQLARVGGDAAAQLRRGERMNLRAVVTIAQVAVAVVVGLAIFAFFLVFGVLVVGLDTVRSWSTEAPQVWWRATIGAHEYALTSEHVRVSAFLGVFSAFYFVVSASTDRALRANLTERAREHAATCLAVRAVYLSLR